MPMMNHNLTLKDFKRRMMNPMSSEAYYIFFIKIIKDKKEREMM